MLQSLLAFPTLGFQKQFKLEMNQVPGSIDLCLLKLRWMSAMSPFGTTLPTCQEGAGECLPDVSWKAGCLACIHFVYLGLCIHHKIAMLKVFDFGILTCFLFLCEEKIIKLTIRRQLAIQEHHVSITGFST